MQLACTCGQLLHAIYSRSYFTSIFPAASLIFSTFASDKPLMLHKALRVVIWIPFTVQIPTVFNFLMSAMFCSHSVKKRDAVHRKTDFFYLFVSKQLFLVCYSQSHVSAGGQCLGKRIPVRIEEKKTYMSYLGVTFINENMTSTLRKICSIGMI